MRGRERPPREYKPDVFQRIVDDIYSKIGSTADAAGNAIRSINSRLSKIQQVIATPAPGGGSDGQDEISAAPEITAGRFWKIIFAKITNPHRYRIFRRGWEVFEWHVKTVASGDSDFPATDDTLRRHTLLGFVLMWIDDVPAGSTKYLVKCRAVSPLRGSQSAFSNVVEATVASFKTDTNPTPNPDSTPATSGWTADAGVTTIYVDNWNYATGAQVFSANDIIAHKAAGTWLGDGAAHEVMTVTAASTTSLTVLRAQFTSPLQAGTVSSKLVKIGVLPTTFNNFQDTDLTGSTWVIVYSGAGGIFTKVSGSSTSGGEILKTTTTAVGITITTGTYMNYHVIHATDTLTIALPPATVEDGTEYIISNLSTAAVPKIVTIQRAASPGTDTIREGTGIPGSSIALSYGESVILILYGTNWEIS